MKKVTNLANRFRGFLPIIVDVETSGLDSSTDSMLELAAITLDMDSQGKFFPDKTYAYQIEPFWGANLNPEALVITGIDPGHPLRFAIPEQQALHLLFSHIKSHLIAKGCQRAVLVGHNAWFDLAFIQAAAKRCCFSYNPFHSFTTLDTASLAAVALGETVLAKAARKAGIPFDTNQAHSAIYDAERTAELFCWIVNRDKV